MSEQQANCAAINSAKIKQLLSEQWAVLNELEGALYEVRSTIEILELVSDHLHPKSKVSNAIVVLVSDWVNDFETYSNKLEQAYENHREMKRLVA